MESFDIVVIGGGIAGSSLAFSMSKAGARVLVLESETEFRDRIRGETLTPWGFAEAQALGLTDALRRAGACHLPWLNQYLGPQQIERRDFIATTLTRTPPVTFYHPRMQTALLRAAEDADAEVRRGVVATYVVPGTPPVSCTRPPAKWKRSLSGLPRETAACAPILGYWGETRPRFQGDADVARLFDTLRWTAWWVIISPTRSKPVPRLV